MQQLTNISNEILTMTTREIAMLTAKEHKNVLADARIMLESLEIDCADFSAQYVDASGKSNPLFVLPKRETFILVSGYSIAMRAKIIDRWQELEGKAGPVIPQSLSAALRLAADQAELIEAQQVLLSIAAPKAAFVDAYVDSTGLKGFREAAKLLKANEARLRDFLTDKKIMYRLGTDWMAYQQHIDAGRFSVKTGTNPLNKHSFSRSLFTSKGVEWLAGLWAVHGLNGGAA